MTTTYEVIVGNIGTVHCSTNKETAIQDYNDYVELSKSGYGRAAHEEVLLIANNNILKEHMAIETIFDGWITITS